MNHHIGVTISLDASEEVRQKAMMAANILHLPWKERKATLGETCASDCDCLLIYTKQLPEIWTKDSIYRFHLGTAELRIKQMKRGVQDRLLALLPPRKDIVIVDATFGAGRDATVFSWYVGNAGKVISLEKSAALWAIGKEGLAQFSDSDKDVIEALRRIELYHYDFVSWLLKAQSKSVDVIYFDTMFKHPVKRNANHIEVFRKSACYDTLQESILLEACRVARECIIVKERSFSPLFKNELFTKIDSKRGQSTAYGVITCKNRK